MAIGMMVIIGCAVAAINLGPLTSGIWFSALMWPAAYLMFIGFTGFDLLNDPRKLQKRCEKPLPPAGPFIVHSC
jgi:hypothetical protein